jgi:hypothetical protein
VAPPLLLHGSPPDQFHNHYKHEPWKRSSIPRLHWDIHQKLFVLGQYSTSLLHHKKRFQEHLFPGLEYPLHFLRKSDEQNIPLILLYLYKVIVSAPLGDVSHPHNFRKNKLCPEHHLYTPHKSYDRLTQGNNTFDNAYRMLHEIPLGRKY